jgi:hypothetical protein
MCVKTAYNEASKEMDEFVDQLVRMEQNIVEALVYAARAQGFRAGVKPYKGPRLVGSPPIKRVVFIEYPEKTVEWTYPETRKMFLDSLPRYEK